MKIDWHNSYSVGHEVFDEHHKKLFGFLGNLYECDKDNGESDELIVKTMKELMDYSKYHFSQEEKVLAAGNYPGLESQKEEHAYFISKVKEYCILYIGDSKPLLGDVVDFLSDWLIQHIMDCDLRYAQFLKDERCLSL